jgi:hypothetical protein
MSHEKDMVPKNYDVSLEHEEHFQAPNLEYTDDEHEPKIHLRTWIALLALCLQSFVQLWSLMGPPAVVGSPKHPRKILQIILTPSVLAESHSSRSWWIRASCMDT